ncbi:asparaginase [Hansschlegelia beijingensis]|uniref:L-asparaginase II n=1 Tax=Hansschlegelia beijingensis TaxID=1133344 RepID=A0A7W6GGX3_9HYPH|nr:asparaginase [Hansschlegelia beijingensis]MBB3974568.1 L-asparaginase II [Hansschlegelia beijingensis]
MTASAPLVEVTRGLSVESRHTGAVAIADVTGKLVFSLGDAERLTFPRSGVKALQGLPLVESGAAARFGLTEAELALACASHGGEPEHVATAAGALARLGLTADALECGAHWPMNDAAARALAASGAGPTTLHNNCSGKHAGFLCLACAMEVEPAGYIDAEHPVQREVTAALEAMTGTRLAEAPRGVDGCGIPTFAMPLAAVATAFARFGAGHGLGEHRAAAARTLREAAWSAPFQIGGSGRFDTEAMQLGAGRVFVKMGAEGVHVGAIPELGYGVAIKIDDGATRAAEAVMAAVLIRLLAPEGDFGEWLAGRVRRPLRNWAGVEVGEVRATELLAG